MENKTLKLFYKVIDDTIVLECFFNNYFKGHCLVNLELDKTVLNEKYFSSIFPKDNKGEVFVRIVYCMGLKMEGCRFKMDNLTKYEGSKIPLYGILGRDFFRGYKILEIDKATNSLCLAVLQ